MVYFQLERAYDKIMMSQLSNRKKGLTFASFKVPYVCSVCNVVSWFYPCLRFKTLECVHLPIPRNAKNMPNIS